jgi:deazaflavin-dependent oxidoreductase (nitroreductase family)
MTFPRVLSRIHADYINKIVLRFVTHTTLADLEHVGRRSGLVRHTPLRAFRTQDRVVIALNFGRESDWLKNIQTSGQCRMRLGDQMLELTSPRIVSLEQVVNGMPWAFGVGLRYVVHTTDCVELSIISSAPAETSMALARP